MGEHSRPVPVDQGTGSLPGAGTTPSLALLLADAELAGLLGRVFRSAGRDIRLPDSERLTTVLRLGNRPCAREGRVEIAHGGRD
jgi:hypothetical protein